MNPKSSRAIGTWCALLGFVAVAAVFVLWVFLINPALRQQLILFALGCVLACVVVVALYQRNAGGRRSLADVAGAAFSGAAEGQRNPAAESAALPRTIPSRRSQQRRSIAWSLGTCTVLVGVAALAAGTPQRSDMVERLHSAGAEFALLPADKVSDVRRKSSSGKDPYTATVRVQLPGGSSSEPVSATVRTMTTDEPRPGDRVRVLYAPSQPNLGAVAGDERSLGPELRGESLSTVRRWFLIAIWVLAACFALGLVSTRHGFRAFSRLGEDDKAIRGQCTGAGRFTSDSTGAQSDTSKDKYLKIRTESGTLHFLMNITKRQLPEEMQGQGLWLCWDTRRGARGGRLSPSTTPAALVFDTGLVAHGMLNVEEGKSLAETGVPVEKLSATDRRSELLRLWDPRSEWPLYVPAMMLGLYAAIIACTALLTFDLATEGWRWGAGIVGFLAGLAAVGLHLEDDDGPSERAAA